MTFNTISKEGVMRQKINLTISLAILLSSTSATAQFSDREILASRLFNVPLEEIDKSRTGLNYNYNTWKKSLKGYGGSCDGYVGGHSGIDIQTKDVAGHLTADREFYSVSSGTVINSGTGKFNTISIYNSQQNKSYIYLHAREVSVNTGDIVSVGDELGIQGSAGVGSAEHVHFEVRNGRKTNGACGASTTIDPEKNAIEHLVPHINSNVDTYGYVSKNDWRFYRVPFSLAPGNTIDINLYGLSRNADLYVKNRARPEQFSYDCRSTRMWGLSETCKMGAGTWVIGVRGVESTNYILEHKQ